MSIRVSQGELERVGFQGDFNSLRRPDRVRVAAMALEASGRRREAFLLQINNPVAIAGIVHVQDFQQGMPGPVG